MTSLAQHLKKKFKNVFCKQRLYMNHTHDMKINTNRNNSIYAFKQEIKLFNSDINKRKALHERVY